MIRDSKTVRIIRTALVSVIALVLIYPLVWMVVSSFKPEDLIFKDLSLIPRQLTLENYAIGWLSSGRVTFTTYFYNSILISVLAVIGNILSCSLVAYSFARLEYRGRKLFFSLMLMTMMPPVHATIVPQFAYFHKMGWVDTILPIVIPKFLATDAFFIFLIVQFYRGIPRDLDEAAIVDGCNHYSVFYRILLPLAAPALITTTIFTFMWTWNDFFTQIIYLRTPTSYTATLGLRMFIDRQALSQYGAMFAMSTLSIVPILVLFVTFQRLLIEGVATSGIKG